MSCTNRFTKRIESEGASPIGDLERESGRKAKESGGARKGRKPAALDAGFRPSRIYAHGDAVHCIGAHKSAEVLRNCEEGVQPTS